MNCLDCSTDDRTSTAVGACTTCGAGVCAEHLELDTHVTKPYTGVGASHEYRTRAVTCAACAPVMTAMHHTRYAQKSGAAVTARH